MEAYQNIMRFAESPPARRRGLKPSQGGGAYLSRARRLPRGGVD